VRRDAPDAAHEVGAIRADSRRFAGVFVWLWLDAPEMSGVQLSIGLAVAAKTSASSNAGRAVTDYPGGVTFSESRSKGLAVLLSWVETRA
jgi:hypothetical protein